MNIRKPEYYDKFVCIADRCPITCCREWKIGVDDLTNQKWKELKPPKEVHPVRKNLSQYTGKKDGARVIALNKKHLCPFLDEKKLCRLVCTYGDDILSETCRVFPREVHTFDDRKEFFLMPSCPAVIDLMRKYPECDYIENKITETQTAQLAVEQNEDSSIQQFENDNSADLTILRKARSIFSDWMRRREYTPSENLKHIFFAALELHRILQEGQASSKILKSLEEYESAKLQEELSNAISKIPSDREAAFYEQNELFLDLTVNYEREGLYQAELSFTIDQAKQLEGDSDFESYKVLKEKSEFEADFSNWNELMRSFLTAEIESDCLLPEGTMQDFLIHLEWIALEYAAIKHFLFLDRLENGTLTYERVRSAIVLICRMTGYEEDDIYEYLEDSFEDIIWEWGYLALILS